MPIRVLPQEVASSIAAGEVVERPASVVKELLENALDAGATRIEIVVEGGGSALIEVGDDGCGIPAAEVPLALARYSTSKLEKAEDLFTLQTLGFRGEALAAIAAVSRLELVTRSSDDLAGTRLMAEGGQRGEPKAVGAPPGTQVRVRDLFFNVPARKSFLKRAATERAKITELVSRYALAYPGVAMRLTQDGRLIFHATGRGEARETLAAVFGLDMARQMIALPQTQAGQIRVWGYISPPSVHRANRRGLTFFVNGRWIQDAKLSAAVVQAYHGLIMVGRFPTAFLFLQAPPESVDINVHPAKAEVRFRDPGMIFSVVQRVVRAALLGQAPPAVELETRWSQSPASGPWAAVSPDWQAAGWQDSPHGLPGRPEQRLFPGGPLPLLRAVGQVGGAYLVAEGPDGLYLIDQHAAHERVLFEAMMAAWREGAVQTQALLEPVSIEVAPAQVSLLQSHLDALRGLGFEIEPFGEGVFRLRAMPALVAHMAPQQVLQVMLDEFEEDESPLADEVEARLAARVCTRAAVKAGQVLSMAEQEKLLRDLEKCDNPRTCPHGRPTMIHLSVDALEKQFGRRG
jgi:DNA mismatch repair protein MutL